MAAPPDPARIVSLHEEILHLGRLVDDLQVLALADAGGLSLQREAVDLAALARRIAEPYRSQAIAVDDAAGDPVVRHATRFASARWCRTCSPMPRATPRRAAASGSPSGSRGVRPA